MEYKQEIPKGMVVKKKTLGDAILEHLTANGWRLGSHESYNRELAFDPEVVVEFLKSTQPKQLTAFHRDEIAFLSSRQQRRCCRDASGHAMTFGRT